MEIIIGLALPTLAVWALVFHAHYNRIASGLEKQFGAGFLSIPLLGSLVIVVGTVFGPEFFSLSLGPFPLTFDRGLIVVLIGYFVWRYFQERESITGLRRSELWLVFLYVYLTISLLLHDWQFREKMPLSRMIFFYFLPLMIYGVMRTVTMNRSFLSFHGGVMAVLALYLAVTGIAEKQDWGWLVYPGYIMQPGEFLGRARGPLLNPVINGILMTYGGCCLWMGWSRGERWHRALIVAGSLVIAAGIFCTMTRSVWMAYAASAILFLWYPASRKAKSVMWIVGVCVLVVSFPLVGDKLFSFKRDKDVSQADMEMSARLRPIFAAVAWNMFQDRPLFGCGFGQYSREKWPYLSDPHSELPLLLAKDYLQHNVFLAYLTELGVLGMGLLIATLLAMAYQGYVLWSNRNLDLLYRQQGLLMMALLANFSINGMFHDVSIIPMTNLLWLFQAGLVINLWGSMGSRPTAAKSAPHRSQSAQPAAGQ